MRSARNTGDSSSCGWVKRREEREAANSFRMVQCQLQGDGAAQRVADDERLLKAKRFGEFRERARLGEDRGRRCLRRPRGIAAARPVNDHQAIVALELLEERIGEVTHLAGKPVNAEDGRAGAPFEVVDARAVDVDEASERRQRVLDLPRRARGEQDERADPQNEKHNQDEDDPRQDDHVCLSSKAPSATASR